MTYIINRSDGNFLLNLVDEKVDTTSISVPLIGKNVSDYGEYYNNTLVALVENFASSQQPNSPLIGQLWYDKTAKMVKVFNSNGVFESIVPNIANPAEPKLSSVGDIWVDTTNAQLKFKSTSTGFSLAGPIYTKSQGISGFQMITLKDTDSDPREVLAMYSKNKLMAIMSTEAFSVSPDNIGSTDVTGSVGAGGISVVSPGINMNIIPDTPELRLIGRAAQADLADFAPVGLIDMNSIPPIYLTNYPGGRDVTTGTLYVNNNEGLKIGTNADILLEVSSSVSNIKQNVANQQLRLVGRNIDSGDFSAVVIDSQNIRVGILTETPQEAVDINGSTVVRGNLTVLGESNFVITNDLRVNDKTIELNYSTSPVTDIIADGGGIILHGSTDHSLTWTQTNAGAWQSSENFDLINESSNYKIAGQTVLTNNSLGIPITSAPGLTSLGILTNLQVGDITISGNTIASTDFDRDIIINPSGTGRINVANTKIINVSTCTDPFDAVNKQYVDNAIYQYALRISFSVDETNWGGNPQDYIIPLLEKMFPVENPPEFDPYNIPDGARARILCSFNTFMTTAITTATATRSTVLVDKGGIQNSQDVLQDINFSIPSVPVTFSTTYTVREFLVQGREWIYVGVVN